jgi:hypothetical protein
MMNKKEVMEWWMETTPIQGADYYYRKVVTEEPSHLKGWRRYTVETAGEFTEFLKYFGTSEIYQVSDTEWELRNRITL